jgi:septal ring factor EnvC (AmiA/AmiB activator)
VGVIGRIVLVAIALGALPHLPHLPHLRHLPDLPYVLTYAQSSESKRVSDRIRALQAEAEGLAAEARTLLGDLRRLEIERDLQAARVTQAEAAAAGFRAAVVDADARLAALERERVAQLPDLRAQLVDIYKQGRGGYARLILEANGIRELGRLTRAVAALGRINAQRVADHRRTLEQLRQERAVLAQKSRELLAAEAEARQSRAAAERAVAARAALLEQIDARRDLNAQFAGELQVAEERLQQQVANLAAGRPAEAVIIPVAPFRGALPWPLAGGRISRRFGQAADRAPAGAVRNGIEIAAPAGAAVSAVHGGTVAYAEAFTGFGTLVIVDHGDNTFTLYGHLATASVSRGQAVETGAELGRVGTSPAGGPALYFEIRVDGRSVDPVQWLRPR